MSSKWRFFQKKLQELPSPQTCHHVQNGYFFPQNIIRIAQRLGASPPGPHCGILRYLVHNLHNQKLSKSVLQDF